MFQFACLGCGDHGGSTLAAILAQAPDTNTDAMLAVVLFLLFYFLPSIVAICRGHHNAAAIAVLNLLLGWTCIGWIVALVWAFTAVQSRQPVHYHYHQPQPASPFEAPRDVVPEIVPTRNQKPQLTLPLDDLADEVPSLNVDLSGQKPRTESAKGFVGRAIAFTIVTGLSFLAIAYALGVFSPQDGNKIMRPAVEAFRTGDEVELAKDQRSKTVAVFYRDNRIFIENRSRAVVIDGGPRKTIEGDVYYVRITGGLHRGKEVYVPVDSVQPAHPNTPAEAAAEPGPSTALPEGAETEYDKSDNTTSIRLRLGGFTDEAGRHVMSVSNIHTGKEPRAADAIMLLIVRRGPRWEYVQSHDVKIMCGDQHVKIGEQYYDQDLDDKDPVNHWREVFVITFPSKDLQTTLERDRDLEVRIGTHDPFPIGPITRGRILQFVRAVRSGAY